MALPSRCLLAMRALLAKMATTLNLVLNSKNIAVMKKLMKSLMLFAAAAMALTSCDNEGMNEGIESNDTYTMTFTAGAPESRTSVAIEGNEAKFSWCEDDVVGFVQSAVEVEKVNKKKSKSIALESGVATFTTEFEAVDGASTYNYGAFYPDKNWVSSASFASVKVELPAIQTLTDDSFDHEADLLMSEPIWNVAENAHGGLLKFARLAAIGKMTLKGINADETIESVKLTFADHVLAGDVTLNFDEVTATYVTEGSNISNSVEVKNGSLVAKAENEIFFTCFPGTYSGAYRVDVTTDVATYYKEGNLSDKSLAFTAGDVTGFSATVGNRQESNIKTFTKITATNLADYSGTYLLVYEAGNVAFDGSLTTLDIENNTKPVTIENDAITASVDIAFTIAKVDGGYSIQSASGKFIGRSATSNGLSTADEYGANYLNTIVDLVIKGAGGKELRYNDANDQKRFRYLGNTMKPVALYRMEGTGSDDVFVRALESIAVSGAKTTFTVGEEWAFGGTVTAKYNDYTTEDVTATATVNHSAVLLDTPGEYTVTVTCEDKSTTYTVTVSEEQSGVAGWVKISALSELAAGDKVALVGTVGTTNYSMTTNGASSAPTATTVTINGNTLTSVDGITTFNIGKDGSNYILYEGDATSTWLYCTSSNNGVRSGTNANKTWIIAAHSNNGSNFEFKHVGTSRYLGIYNKADWRCYTAVDAGNFTGGTGTSDIAIYKNTAGGEGGETPDPEEPETPEEIEAITIAEFLEKPENANVWYQLTGTMLDIYNTTYGNFHLNDGVNDVVVYGLTATKVDSNDKSFSSLNLEEGDIVTIIGTRSSYTNSSDETTIQVGGPAYYVSHIAKPGVKVDSESLSLKAEGESKTFTVTTRGEGELNYTVEGDWIEVTSADNTYTVSADANESEDARTATITFTYGEATATVTVSQSGKSVGGDVETKTYTENFTTWTENSTTNTVNGSKAGNACTWSYVGASKQYWSNISSGSSLSFAITLLKPGSADATYVLSEELDGGITSLTLTARSNNTGTGVNIYVIDVDKSTTHKVGTLNTTAKKTDFTQTYDLSSLNITGKYQIKIANKSTTAYCCIGGLTWSNN